MTLLQDTKAQRDIVMGMAVQIADKVLSGRTDCIAYDGLVAYDKAKSELARLETALFEVRKIKDETERAAYARRMGQSR